MAGIQAVPFKRKGGERLRLTKFCKVLDGPAKDSTQGRVLWQKEFRDRQRSRKQSEQLFKFKYVPRERRQSQVCACTVFLWLSGYMRCRNEEMNIQLFGRDLNIFPPDFHPRSILLKGGRILVLI